MTNPEIVVSAVLMYDPQGRVLTVRKRGTSKFMMPGGKPEAGETPAQTAAREFAEELGVPLQADRLVDLGEFTSAAANEAGHTVRAAVFAHPHVAVTNPQAEIAELQWVDPQQLPAAQTLAPLLLDVLSAIERGEIEVDQIGD